MTTKRRFHYSLVQFRKNPLDPATNTKTLGFVVGFATPKLWAVCVAMRVSLETDFLRALDPLSQEILESRSRIMTAEIDAAMSDDKRPAEIMAAIAHRNQFSLFVTGPREIEIDAGKVNDGSAEKIAEEYVLTLYSKIVEVKRAERERVLHPSITPNPVGNSAIAADELGDIPLDVPPPWMLPVAVRFRAVA